jgi:hypothetical protein
VPGDHAIESAAQDKLGRGPFVRALAQAVRGLDASQGAVIGLVGPWGLGKSSVLNMLGEELTHEPQLVTVRFEPWLFSGASELISLFFADISGQLRGMHAGSKSERLADLLDTYGQSLGVLKWVPVAGPWLDRAGSIAKFFNKAASKRMDEARKLTTRRDQLTAELKTRDTPIVVIIDELDRLRPHEVRDLFQLVRLTGQFPNLIYVLAFDRQRAEKMLEEAGIEGRAYLEKIIEIVYNLPPVSRAALDRVFTSELSEALEGVHAGPFQQDRWPDVLARGIRPLLRDLRDVRRFLAALPATLAAVGQEVALVDVLALEALRVLRPDVFEALAACRAGMLTQVAPAPQAAQVYRADRDAVVEAAGQDPAEARVVSDLLRLLFPATDQYNTGGLHYDMPWVATWRKERRVASRHVLDIYLEQVLSPGVAPVGLIERLVANLTDEHAFTAVLGEADDQMLEDVLDRLAAYEREFSTAAVEPATSALLSLYPRMRTSSNPLDVGGDMRIDLVVLRLLQVVKDPDALRDIVEHVVDRQPSLYARMRLLLLIARQPAGEQYLIPEPDTGRLLGGVYRLVRSATTRQLVSEPHLITLLYNAVQDSVGERTTLDEQLGEPQVMAAVLRDSLGTVSTWNIGSVAISHEPRLNWDGLVAVCGGSARLASLLDSFRHTADPSTVADAEIALALRLAGEHLQAGPPAPRWSRSATTTQLNNGRTRDILRVRDEPAAELVLRAASLHMASPQKVEQSSLLTNQVHQALQQHLAKGEIIDAVHAYCAQHGATVEPDAQASLENDNLTVHMAVARRIVTAPDAPVTVTVRAAITSPGTGDTYVRVITETWIARSLVVHNPSAKHPATPPAVSIVEARDLLAAALGTAADISATLLPDVYDDHTLPHARTEIHIACGELTQTTSYPALTDVIDLTPLGPSTHTNQHREGDYTADSTQPISDATQRRALVNHALRYLTGTVWRYPDADTRLLDLLRPMPGE